MLEVRMLFDEVERDIPFTPLKLKVLEVKVLFEEKMIMPRFWFELAVLFVMMLLVERDEIQMPYLFAFAVLEVKMLFKVDWRPIPLINPCILQSLISISSYPLLEIPVPNPPCPKILKPPQSNVIPEAPISIPLEEQFRRLESKVVLLIILSPQLTCVAETTSKLTKNMMANKIQTKNFLSIF